MAETISVSDSSWKVSDGGYYGSNCKPVDVTGFSYVYAYVTTLSGTVSIDMLRI